MEGVYFKLMQTINVVLLVSDLTEEQFSHVTCSINVPWNNSEICNPM